MKKPYQQLEILAEMLNNHKQQAIGMVQDNPSIYDYINAFKHMGGALGGSVIVLNQIIEEIKTAPPPPTSNVEAGWMYYVKGSELNGYEGKWCFTFYPPENQTHAPYIALYQKADTVRKWKQIATYNYIDVHRTGWLGVWDALKAALTGNNRLSVPQKRTTEMWVQVASPEELTGVGTAEGKFDGFFTEALEKGTK